MRCIGEPQALIITVRFFNDCYHGQEDGFEDACGWPPSSGRLFQALVAGAACGAALSQEDAQALQVLEALEPPCIAAPPMCRGRPAKHFVPNNDIDAKGGDPGKVGEIRAAKTWHPLFFDPEIPLLYIWQIEPRHVGAAKRICEISERLYQLGRGIDPAWASGRIVEAPEDSAILSQYPGIVHRPTGSGSVPAPRPGSLDSLSDRYRQNRHKFVQEGSGRKARLLFTQPSKALFQHTAYDAPPRRLHFELRTDEGGFSAHPLAAAGSLVSGLRDDAAARLREALPQYRECIERFIVGRGATARDLPKRIRLIPIPSIGHKHVAPAIRRLMVEVPQDCPFRADDIRWAFSGLAPRSPEGQVDDNATLAPSEDSVMADRFGKEAVRFQSLTPIAIPNAHRHKTGARDASSQREARHCEERSRAAACVAQALRQAGISTPHTSIHLQREPFHIRGKRSERFSEGTRFPKHALWHVELEFLNAIAGPLLIGDGRFIGLGLMTPADHFAQIFSLEFVENPVKAQDRSLIVHHVRRALMALSRDSSGHVPKLFSGHEADGSADGHSGRHEHVFLAVDAISGQDQDAARLIVAAPWSADRQSPRRNADRQRFDKVVRSLSMIRAGRLGILRIQAAMPMQEGDPVIGPAREWKSATPYVATRHLKQRDRVEAFFKQDVTRECLRRGLPAPLDATLSRSVAGPRGGKPSAMISLRFPDPVQGPVLLGKGSHSGSGLFRARMAANAPD